MEHYEGKIGTIVSSSADHIVQVEFDDKKIWAYPFPKVLEHLFEKEKSINEILNDMKNLILEI